jgi:multisubunit Na+/H+ antiporter MnhB subunit
MGFWVLAMLGYVFATFFAANFLAQPGDFQLYSGGTIPLANIAIGLKVGACIAGAFVMLSLFRDEIKEPLPGNT